MVAPAIPVLMQHKKTTIGILANAANSKFHYNQYFSMLPHRARAEEGVLPRLLRARHGGTSPSRRRSRSSPPTRNSRRTPPTARASDRRDAAGFKIVFDQNYPPTTTDFTPIMRAVQAANPDIVYVAAYPPDTVGIVRAANEIGLTPKMFGGTLIGLLVTAVKMQLGPLTERHRQQRSFLPAPAFNFPGTLEVLAKYQAIAAGEGIDPLGWAFPPLGYAAGQVLAQAVEGDQEPRPRTIAALHPQPYFQHGRRRHHVRQGWRMGKVARCLHAVPERHRQRARPVQGHDPRGRGWPNEYKSGDMIYPYAKAKKP